MGNITIKPVWSATVEEIIRDLTHPEDMDTTLMINHADNGKIWVNEWDGLRHAYHKTLKGALITFGLDTWRATTDPQKMIEWDELEELEGNSLVLDWRDAKLPICE